ncbi:MAG: hypothetical protein AAGG08_06080 [Actinomycetota bacterium]
MRAEAIGVEVTNDTVRAVRIHPDAPDGVVAADELSVENLEDDALDDVFLRLQRSLSSTTAPVRVAWFAPGNVLHTIDVTGANADDLRRLRRRYEHDVGITTTILLDHLAHRWLLAVDWNDSTVGRIRRAAIGAGFTSVEVEPAPISVARLVLDGHVVIRRGATAALSWSVVSRDGVPIAAATTSPGAHEAPSIDPHTAARRIIPLDRLAAPNQVAAFVRAADEAPDRAHTSEPVALRYDDATLPEFPGHDVRAPARLAVALGAAMGPGGVGGDLRTVEVVAPTSASSPTTRRPWTVEATAPIDVNDDAPPSRWRRAGGRRGRRTDAGVPSDV